MRKMALLALTLLAPSFAQAADWGLGATISSSSGTLFVPIAVNETMRLEPFGSFVRSEVETGTGTATFTDLTLGAGLFRLHAIGDRAQSYWGGRASFLRDEVSGGGLDSTENGFGLEAVVGGEAFLLPQVSLAVEGFAFLLDVEDTSAQGSGARVIARVFFQ